MLQIRLLARCLHLFLVSVPASWSLLGAGEAPLQVGSTKQLFLGPWTEDGRDGHLVESMTGVTIRMNEARATGERLMVQDRPWEGTGMLDMRQFVLRDGDRFRIYYSALPFHEASESDPVATSRRPRFWTRAHQRILCYGESADGIHWEKPNLGLVSWNGSRENNILFPNDEFPYLFSEMEGAWVFIDPDAPHSEEKYKMFVKISPIRDDPSRPKEEDPPEDAKMLAKGQYAFVSADGIRWRLLSQERIPVKHDDTQFSVFRDQRIGMYVAYTRRRRPSPAQTAYYRKRYGIDGRTMVLTAGRIVSHDFRTWTGEDAFDWNHPGSHPVLTISPDAVDQAGSPRGLTRMDFYGPNVSKYAGIPDAYIALPNAYYHWEFDLTRKNRRGKPIQLPSTLDVQLMTSRDGIRWSRTPERRPFIWLGPKGSFWSSMLWPSNVLVVRDEVWIYFAGLDVSHKEQSLLKSDGARTRAVLRLDGFLSADAAYTGGELTTRPLVFTGNRLQLNLATGAGGVLRVEILDLEGRPLPGYELGEADDLNGNYIRVLASWQGSPDLGSLAGTPVKLRFVMRDTKLYSFQFLSADKTGRSR